MTTETFNVLAKIKDEISPRLMGISGVVGVGVQAEGLTVYLDEDTAVVRDRVMAIADDMYGNIGGIVVHFVVSGRFEKRRVL